MYYMKNVMQNKIVISGMGVVTAGCNNVAEFKDSLKNGKSGIKKVMYADDGKCDIKIGALLGEYFLGSDEFEKYIDIDASLYSRAKKILRNTSLSEKASVMTALEAWCDAGLYKFDIDPELISIIVGGSNLTKKISFDNHDSFMAEPCYLSPQYAMKFFDTNHVGILSELFQIKGEGFSVGGASASGNMAIIEAMRLLRYGLSDICVVVGALSDLSLMELQSFMNIGALAGKKFADRPEEACRPFDEQHEGFVYGQGCGCLILETEESVERRQGSFYAKLLGGGMCLDGNHLTNPNKDGEIKAMKKAIDDAKLSIEDILYLNAHGSSSSLGDNTECEAIKELFGEHLKHMMINSTKGITGHCLSAAGVIEAIASIIQMNDRFIHDNINLENPIDEKFTLVRGKRDNVDVKIAMSNSFGFSGINTSIIIERNF